jgi:predicted ABC-type ATPase
VLQGGHAVPADKIEPRYWRSLDLLPDAISNSSRAYLFDNSGQEHRLIAEFEDARLISISPNLPGWFVKAVLNRKDGRDSA